MVRLRGRFRRKPVLLVLLGLGVAGAVLITALDARPGGGPSVAVALEDGHVGTAYAFDGVVCLDGGRGDAELTAVEVVGGEGGTTAVEAPADGPPVVGFPVEPGAGGDPVGYVVEGGTSDCELRVLVTPDRQGEVRAGTLRLTLSYGPGGLLRRTVEVEPPVVLDVTATGPDPRSDAS